MRQLIIEFGSECIALTAGLLCIARLKAAYRILYLHVCIVVLVDLIGRYLKTHHTDNQFVFNYYLILDCGMPLLAAYHLLERKVAPVYFFAGFATFLLVWLRQISEEPDAFALGAYIIDSILLISTYLFVLYRTAMEHKEPILKLPAFWLCIGIILFYGCNIPYFSVLEYWSKQVTPKEKRIFYITLMVLNNVRYLCIAAAFICCYYFTPRLRDKPGMSTI